MLKITKISRKVLTLFMVCFAFLLTVACGEPCC